MNGYCPRALGPGINTPIKAGGLDGRICTAASPAASTLTAAQLRCGQG